MLCRTLTSFFSHVVRKVDPRGFHADFQRLAPSLNEEGKKHVKQVLGANANALFCGSWNTGKLSLLMAIGSHYEHQCNKKVAYVSADPSRANRMGGLLLHHFAGLRLSRDDLPSQEQLEGTFDRHVRLMESSLGQCTPTLKSADVLILDSVEKISPPVFFALEAVARRVKGRPTEPFGGLRLVAAANIWEMPVTPSSDTGGYLFQSKQWSEIFPLQRLLKRTFGQDPKLTDLVEKAQFGTLSTDDIKQLETSSTNGSTTKKTSLSEEVFCDADKKKMMTPIVSNLVAITQRYVRFPKQRARKVFPEKFRLLKQTDIGNFIVNMLVQSSTPASFGLVESLSVDIGDPVHLLYDSNLPVGAGAVGEVIDLKEHAITVHFFEKDCVLDIHRMRIECYHPDYPEIVYEIRQFPLFPREKLCPLTIRNYPHAFHVNISGLDLTDTNDLGCLLSRMRSFSDFSLSNIAAFTSVDNMIHEPTRIYYHHLLGKPICEADEHWCRNCKSFVPSKSFFEHWEVCVSKVRWCHECDKTIPVEQLEPHKEKHQLVLCLDCGQAIEWRHWEEHRLSCSMMMREISPLNEFLPLRTRQLALELGLDKRDLHTMKSITKQSLPKPKIAGVRLSRFG